MQCPLPLAAIAIRRDLAPALAPIVDRALRASVDYAFEHPEASRDYVAAHAQEMDPDVTERHIRLYVNDYTLALDERPCARCSNGEQRGRASARRQVRGGVRAVAAGGLTRWFVSIHKLTSLPIGPPTEGVHALGFIASIIAAVLGHTVPRRRSAPPAGHRQRQPRRPNITDLMAEKLGSQARRVRPACALVRIRGRRTSMARTGRCTCAGTRSRVALEDGPCGGHTRPAWPRRAGACGRRGPARCDGSCVTPSKMTSSAAPLRRTVPRAATWR